MSPRRVFVVGLAGFSLLLVSCGGDESAADAASPEANTGTAADTPAITGISTISVGDAAAIVSDPPAELVVLDVRTAEEFANGHLEGAVVVDFYAADFAEQLAALDTDVPYVVYCQSGNRSGQALDMMEQLGFASVVEVDGGILAWTAAGLPVTTD